MTRHTQHWHGTRSAPGPVDAGGCCAGEVGWGRVCDETYPHDPHFYVRFIAGGEPGPVDTTSHVCPGRALSAPVSDNGAGVDPTPTRDLRGRQNGTSTSEEDA